MKKILLFGYIVLTLNSCKFIEKGISFVIQNESKFTLEKVRFSTSENLAVMKFDKIEPKECVSDFLTMKENKSDGTYVFEFTRNGKKETKSYGYYTNGGALDARVKFEIRNDTIMTELSGFKY